MFVINLDEATYLLLKTLAKEEGKTESEFLRKASPGRGYKTACRWSRKKGAFVRGKCPHPLCAEAKVL